MAVTNERAILSLQLDVRDINAAIQQFPREKELVEQLATAQYLLRMAERGEDLPARHVTNDHYEYLKGERDRLAFIEAGI